MKILAFDSTAKAASVAVCENERLLALYNIDNGMTHSELLLPMAENILSSLKLDISDIDLFATAVGPGSFTGVRIGTSLIKGLAFGRDIPCAEVSTLEALAENLAGTVGLIVACIDARRSQVYTASFLSDGKSITRLTEDRAMSLISLADELRHEDKSIYLVGDGYEMTRRAMEREAVDVCSTPPLAIYQSAYSIARVAYRKYLQGEYTDDASVKPTYLRMPQAERERLERLKIKEEN